MQRRSFIKSCLGYLVGISLWAEETGVDKDSVWVLLENVRQVVFEKYGVIALNTTVANSKVKFTDETLTFRNLKPPWSLGECLNQRRS